MFPKGSIRTNERISNLIKIIKPFIIHFLDSSASVNYCLENQLIKYNKFYINYFSEKKKLKLWIQILIPQVVDFKAELSLQIQV